MEPRRFPLGARLGGWALSLMLALAACSDRELPTAARTLPDRPSMSIASAGQSLTLGNAKLWIGLKNSDAVGLRLDVRAEVLLNGVVVGSGDLQDVAAGSSGFNNAVLQTIALAVNGAVSVPAGAVLTFRPSVRRTCIGTGHKSGTVRFWYDGPAIDHGTTRNAGSRFAATLGTESSDYFHANPATLSVDAGTARQFVDVAVNSTAACPARPFSSLGEWNLTVVGGGTATSMIALTDDDQTASAGTAVAEPPSVRVLDAFGNPVAGVSVTFTAAPVGAVTGSPAITDVNGVATVGSWTLGTTVGIFPERVQNVTATAGALSATFVGRGVAGAPVSMTFRIPGGGPFGPPVNDMLDAGEQTTVVTDVKDAYGNSVFGQTVNFSSSDDAAVTISTPRRQMVTPFPPALPFEGAPVLVDVRALVIGAEESVEIRASLEGRPDIHGAVTITVTKAESPVAKNDAIQLDACVSLNCHLGPITKTTNVFLDNGSGPDERGTPAAVITRFGLTPELLHPVGSPLTIAVVAASPLGGGLSEVRANLSSDGTLAISYVTPGNGSFYYELKSAAGTSVAQVTVSGGSSGPP